MSARGQARRFGFDRPYPPASGQGGWVDFGDGRERSDGTRLPDRSPAAQPGTAEPRTAQPKTARPGAAQPGAAQPGSSRRRERDLARLESDIAAREQRIAELETQLADPELYHDASRSKDVVAEYERVRAELESLWQRLAELG